MKKSDIIIAFDRSELNDILKARLSRKFEVNDDQWEQVFNSIHGDDQAWSYMNDAIDDAVLTILKDIKD